MENQDIQNPTPESTLTPVQVSEPRAKFPVVYLVLSLFVLVLLASTVFLYYHNIQLKNMLASYQTQPVVSPTPTTYQSPIPSTTADLTANWKIYTDSKVGFSLKYPNGWSYKLGDTNSTTGNVIFDTNLASGNKNTNYIFDVSLETMDNLNQWTKYSTTTALGSQTVNGLSFEKYVVADMYYSLNYILKQNGKILRFLLYPYDSNQYPTELKTNIDQVLSTFKFIN